MPRIRIDKPIRPSGRAQPSIRRPPSAPERFFRLLSDIAGPESPPVPVTTSSALFRTTPFRVAEIRRAFTPLVEDLMAYLKILGRELGKAEVLPFKQAIFGPAAKHLQGVPLQELRQLREVRYLPSSEFRTMFPGQTMPPAGVRASSPQRINLYPLALRHEFGLTEDVQPAFTHARQLGELPQMLIRAPQTDPMGYFQSIRVPPATPGRVLLHELGHVLTPPEELFSGSPPSGGIVGLGPVSVETAADLASLFRMGFPDISDALIELVAQRARRGLPPGAAGIAHRIQPGVGEAVLKRGRRR